MQNLRQSVSESNPPSMGDVARARPVRGSGAPARCASHYEAILRLLRERAEQGLGVLASELYSRPELYGRSPRNRISEARKAGHLIEGKSYGASDWFYRYLRGANGETYGQPSPEPPNAKPWQDSERTPTDLRGRPLPLTDLPLFDAMRQ